MAPLARLAFVGVMIAIVAVAGCTGTAPPPSQTEIHLKSLSFLYGKYIQRNQGQRPPDEKRFKAFIQQLIKAGEEKIDDMDVLFVSPRDNLPYVVLYGAATGQMVAHEKTGQDGKRYVAMQTLEIREVDDGEFQTLKKR